MVRRDRQFEKDVLLYDNVNNFTFSSPTHPSIQPQQSGTRAIIDSSKNSSATLNNHLNRRSLQQGPLLGSGSGNGSSGGGGRGGRAGTKILTFPGHREVAVLLNDDILYDRLASLTKASSMLHAGNTKDKSISDKGISDVYTGTATDGSVFSIDRRAVEFSKKKHLVKNREEIMQEMVKVGRKAVQRLLPLRASGVGETVYGADGYRVNKDVFSPDHCSLKHM
jgi:hypothetical protein